MSLLARSCSVLYLHATKTGEPDARLHDLNSMSLLIGNYREYRVLAPSRLVHSQPSPMRLGQ